METTHPVDRYTSPEACESAFYDAFRAGDLAAMRRIWGPNDEIVCIHPARPPLAGRRAVMQSWTEILGGTGGVAVKFDCQRRASAAGLAVHVGIEAIGAAGEEPALVTVTNVYENTGRGWTMRLHHASPIQQGKRPRGAMH